MIRRSTWLAIALLVALIGLSFFLRDRQAKEAAAVTPTRGMSPLFVSDEGSPSVIRVENSLGAAVQLSRNAAGVWNLDEPTKTEANQAAAEAAATQIGALRVLSTVSLGPDIIGLDKPGHTLTVTLGNGPPHTLRIGSVTPVQDGYYVQLDRSPFQIVDKFGLDALIRLLENPPYLATPTTEVLANPPAPLSPLTQIPPPTGGSSTAPASSQGPIQVTATP